MLQFTPGFYAKVRIDDEGHIVDVCDLEASDLPEHSHSLKDLLNESELEDKIATILSTFFANNGNSAVVFTYDKNTKTVSADVNIDEEGIIKNEYGQLALGVDLEAGTGNGNSSSSSSSDSDDSGHNGGTPAIIGGASEADLLELRKQIEDIERSIPIVLEETLEKTFASSGSTAVDFIWDKNTKTVSAEVNFDGISIQKDENGDLVATGAVVGSGENGNCASHTHLTSQLEDFQEAVVNIFNDYSKNINIDLNNIIDGTTIKINEYGQLTAVRTATEAHKHYLKDIVDYEAAEVATKQLMSTLGEDVNLSDGVVDFTNLNIGYSILALSKYIREVTDKNVAELAKKIENLSFDKDNTGIALLSVHSSTLKNNLLDLAKGEIREVCFGPSTYLTLESLPYKEGIIHLLKNGADVATSSIENLSNRFAIERAYAKNNFVAKVLVIDVSDLLVGEGTCTFQIAFETEKGIDHSNAITVYYTFNEGLKYVFKDITSKHTLNNKDFYDYPKQLRYQIEIQNFQNIRFVTPEFADGKITGVVDGDKTIQIADLFGNASVDLKFLLEEEHSENDLLQSLTLSKGAVINDYLVAETFNTAYKAEFDIPYSEDCNALQIFTTDPNFEIAKVKLVKANNVAPGTVKVKSGTPGYVKFSNTSYILTFADLYDAGKDRMKLVIESNKDLNLNKLQFRPIAF